jgi:signal transduction histidine kinase
MTTPGVQFDAGSELSPVDEEAVFRALPDSAPTLPVIKDAGGLYVSEAHSAAGIHSRSVSGQKPARRVVRSALTRRGLLIIAIPIAFQLLLLGAIAWEQRAQTKDRAAELRQKEVFASANRVLGLLVDTETAIRGYALTNNPAFTEPFDKAVAKLPAELLKLRGLTSHSRYGHGVDQLEAQARPILTFNNENRMRIAAGLQDVAVASIAQQIGKRLMDRFRAGMDAFLHDQETFAAARQETARRSQNLASAIIWAGFFLNLLLAAAAALMFARSITTRLQVVVENTERLARNEPLRAMQTGKDEIAVLDRHFHEMAAALLESRELLEQSNQELESFSYSVSHDLRAPLRAIDGYAQMIQEDYAAVFDDEGRRHLGVVRAEAVRLGVLIDDLLNFSRLGRKSIAPTEFDMAGLAKEAFVEVTSTAPQRHAVELRVEELPRARGDRTLIRQVLTNLISNAVKFSGKTEEPLVMIGGTPSVVENTYWVRDNGAGFDARYADKLFGVFQRLHHDADFPGTGVGLAIVRRVIQRHGGRVWAESEPGRGACFYFTLPSNLEVQHA